ncbi:MAG: hypothetical protein QOD71_435 [Thermoleophilaceae bacterium]|jgi:ppGpp synthetase/RelA/SpoT-type nucleotidyltranferase|nr:hypothetical protein [Thermoleophilaceae bacterium]
MRIPVSFQVAYDEQFAIVEEVRNRAERRLRVLCENNTWLFDHRTKGPESVLAKLQTGALASIEDMHDFYAAMVLVPTLADVEEAVEQVADAFHTADRRQRSAADAEAFIYDDVHVIVTLGPLGPLDPTGLIGARPIEVQIRTGLQYAWWRATHDRIYKSDASYNVRRVAAELRAALSGADRALGDLDAAAAALPEAPPDADAADTEAIAAWQERWPSERRAADPNKFVETVKTYLDGAELSVADAEALLDAPTGQAAVDDIDLTPAQAVLVTLVATQGVAMLGAIRAAGRRLFVTEEMGGRSPLLEALPLADRVNLAAGSGAPHAETEAAAESDDLTQPPSSPPPGAQSSRSTES